MQWTPVTGAAEYRLLVSENSDLSVPIVDTLTDMVPFIRELQSIVDYRRYPPAVEPAIFPQTLSDWYWSSTPAASENNRVWAIHFSAGKNDHCAIDSSDLYVRAVRGGQ